MKILKNDFDPAEYRSEILCKKISEKINKINDSKKFYNFMEVCGTHTRVFFRYGLKKYIPENIKLISGPGCPVCVTPNERIDKLLAYSKIDSITIVTFGDMFRVPGSCSSLEKEKARGADIRVIYSPYESINIAKENPDKKIIFASIGFETTLPSIAFTLLSAEKQKLKNWFIFCANKAILPAMVLLCESPDVKIDGFICPGHVSAIIGAQPYKLISDKYKKPCVITGFEPLDLLQGILLLLLQKIKKESYVKIQYSRVVKYTGNRKAIEYINKVFEECDSDWRGIGNIKKSGFKLKEKYKNFDIENILEPAPYKVIDSKSCICGDILKGIKTPYQCSLFKNKCRPENPAGACMVSSEGTCSAYYKYG